MLLEFSMDLSKQHGLFRVGQKQVNRFCHIQPGGLAFSANRIGRTHQQRLGFQLTLGSGFCDLRQLQEQLVDHFGLHAGYPVIYGFGGGLPQPLFSWLGVSHVLPERSLSPGNIGVARDHWSLLETAEPVPDRPTLR
jgi:hypothetical protein